MQNDWRKLKGLSSGCLARDDKTNAIAFLEKAIEAARPSNPPVLALMCNGLAKLYLQQGDLPPAETAARRSISQELEFGASSLETTNLASYYMMLAEVLEKQTRFEEALRFVDEAIRIYANHFRSNDPFFENLTKYRKHVENNVWRG